jgi:hypothetical protein
VSVSVSVFVFMCLRAWCAYIYIYSEAELGNECKKAKALKSSQGKRGAKNERKMKLSRIEVCIIVSRDDNDRKQRVSQKFTKFTLKTLKKRTGVARGGELGLGMG